jgi:hypothetical protein
MANGELVERVDPALVRRISELSPGAQRWLKTAVQTIRTMPTSSEIEDQPPAHLRRREPQRLRPAPEPEKPPPPSLEDVITGKAKLEEAEQYPELAEELEGLGEIIDMLRGLGESRRKRGEQILREEILGGKPADEEEPAEDEDDFGF